MPNLTKLTTESAQLELNKLIAENMTRALWFDKQKVSVDICAPEAQLVLDQIAVHAPRSTWMVVRKLKKWRLQNLK